MRIVPIAAALVIAGAAIGVTAATASASSTPSAPSAAQPDGNGSIFIVGGSTAGQSYPWTAALLYDDGFQLCTGSLIASQWVVTAKHCLADVAQVRVGSKDYTTGGTLVGVSRTIGGSDDIGLVKLSKPVPYAPVGVAPKSPAVGSAIQVMGWGVTCDSGCDSPRQLKQLNTTIVQDSKCSSDDIAGSAEICIKVSTAQTPCYGDSGGPALVNGLLVGADSRGGNVCGDAGGEIYSDVTSHLSWITQKTGVRPAA
jgi:secreted trypsin-like serine protease